ncbi:MAG TPA: cytochrome c oxidase assembly protein [Mycobacterium sp.]|nr:cytochrome c oxidase assembly protein [Mycobacterium sp.]
MNGPAMMSWTVDAAALVVVAALTAGYLRCYRRSPGSRGPAWCFAAGLGIWVLATCSAVGVYAPVLFWMRALQVVLLMFVVPFLLAAGRPVATLRGALGERGRGRLDDVLASAPARVLCSPVTTSVAMLGTPWLLYLTPWYVASMTGVLASATRMLLVLIGFGYYYARLQADPVPRRFSPLLSIGVSVVETLGDGLLGLVLWLGPVIAYDYYAALHRSWGPDIRTDQTVGAGILWILGDILGLPFLLVLLRALRVHEVARAGEVDRELDRESERTRQDGSVPDAEPGALWWESDPQLRARFDR